MTENCHCGKDGHAIASVNCPIHGYRAISTPTWLALVDLARNIAGLDDGFLTSADLNYIRETVREWRDDAREALATAPVL
jgi:hypothetical protein